MSKEEDGESVEAIEAEYIALMSKKNERMKAEEKAFNEAEDKKALDKLVADGVTKALIAEKEQLKIAEDAKREEEIANVGNDDIIVPPDSTKGDKPKNGTVLKRVEQMYRKLNRKSGVDLKVDDIEPYSAFNINTAGANPNYDNAFAFADSDSGCGDDVSEWSPADTWCNAIWYAVQCKQQLAGKITVRSCDIGKGDGLTVQIRTISAATFPSSSLGACECSTCTANLFGTHSLTLARYDLYKVMCNLDEWDVGEVLPVAMAQTMVNAFASGIDNLIYVALRDATPGFTETGAASFTCTPGMEGEASYSCCSLSANLYREIIQLEAQMRTAGYFNDADPILIISPRMALYLKYKEGINPPPWVNNITMDGNKLSKIGDIQVIEYCGATSCTNVSTYPVAILIDPTRAVGEAYGKKPHLKSDEDPIECDSWKFVYRMYIAVAALETRAIGHIENP